MLNRLVCLLTFLFRFPLGQFLPLFKFPRTSVHSYGVTVLVLIYPNMLFIYFIQCKAIDIALFLSTPVRYLHDICIVFL